ncbi:uncharacterized protein si:dkey-86e18.1 [Betta splendens]|uniref:Uncharacterized protein si:dkey-86e18.1 n=1 Tax=Betta splendens TaxID=158456 RepID=A0A6P7MFA5_BETSP|nr:uncharacterized protein si:dkey-86e18.1 [Betta splendens]
MARNEEKQQGRLNRLWLQKEREEGRLRDVHQRRPKLATLNSAPCVKKWIPSIKNEIEYCLQQSQLSHYPERKITEFQQQIEALEKEYKSFIAKLRLLDPSCKHKPWTPRAYCKRRAEIQESPVGKKPRSGDDEGESDLNWTRCCTPSATETHEPLVYSETKCQTPVPTNPISATSEGGCRDQDQPLCFDRTRLAVAAAAFRGSSVQLGSSQTQTLARVLQSGLPNLSNSTSRQQFALQSTNTENNDRTTAGLVVRWQSVVQGQESDPGAANIPEKSTNNSTGHVLGLDCYSSDEDT